MKQPKPKTTKSVVNPIKLIFEIVVLVFAIGIAIHLDKSGKDLKKRQQEWFEYRLFKIDSVANQRLFEIDSILND